MQTGCYVCGGVSLVEMGMKRDFPGQESTMLCLSVNHKRALIHLISVHVCVILEF